MTLANQTGQADPARSQTHLSVRNRRWDAPARNFIRLSHWPWLSSKPFATAPNIWGWRALLCLVPGLAAAILYEPAMAYGARKSIANRRSAKAAEGPFSSRKRSRRAKRLNECQSPCE